MIMSGIGAIRIGASLPGRRIRGAALDVQL
jgi:hypothetical protein